MEMTLTSVAVLLYMVSSVTSLHIERTFRDLYAGHWRHIQQVVVNRQSGDVLVGAENAVYKLSPKLDIIQTLKTGPGFDNPLCPPPNLPCNLTKTERRTFIKGLAIDYKDSSLIVCYTLYQGSCMIVDLDDITKVKKEVNRSVVSLNPATSNLMFIAEGPGSEGVLYVGQAYDSLIGGQQYLDQITHISSRRLTDLDFAYSDKKGGTKISVLPDKRSEDKYLVQFLHGFSYGNFVYFVITRNAGHETWMARLCKDDKYFQSYVEMPISCKADQNRRYEEAQSAYYEENSSNLYIAFKMNSSNTGALCAFKMNANEQLFNRTVKNCFEGQGYLGPEYIQQEQKCPKSYEEPKYCGDAAYRAIKGSITIFQKPVVEFDSEVPTSVIAVHKQSSDVLYVGMNSGRLKKIVMLGLNQVYTVDEIQVELVGHGHLIAKDMTLTPDYSGLYHTTSGNKVVKVNVNHCGKKKTCKECTASFDPVCGWCVMTGRCTEAESCPLSEISPHWLPSTSQICAAMSNVNPSILSYEQIHLDPARQEISFKLEKIMLAQNSNPDTHCSFTYQAVSAKTTATVANKVVKCPLPSRDNLDLKPEDFRNLEVEFHVSGHPIVKRSISVYDCTMHQNCTACTKSSFNCSWHYDTHSCKSSSSSGPSATSPITESGKCPRVEVSQGKDDIVVHSGKSKQIAVRLVNMQPGQTDMMKCRFEYLNKVQIVNGTVSASNLVCDSAKFEFMESRAFVSATFNVLWGKNQYPVDIPSKISVQIYKCALMVTSCGRCLTLGQEYECGWCNGTCQLHTSCPSGWLDPSSTCPDPQIFRFSPDRGPIKGQTNISVSGINLGKSYTDIQNGVKVAGINCRVYPDHFEPSIEFKCLTDESPDVQNGTITVTVDGKYTTESTAHFYFVNPEVLGLIPRRGPSSGGTTLQIYGKFMNVGTSRTVDLGGSPCKVLRVNDSDLVCQTSQQVTSNKEVEVQVSFGGYKRLLVQKYTYEEDPVISRVSNAFSVMSGGTMIIVKGERLGLIQNPELFLEGGSQNMTCMHLPIPSQQHFLKCNAPPVSFVPYGKNYSETNPMEVHFGLNLDGVTTYRNLSRQSQFEPIKYYPDPQVQFLPEGDNMVKFVEGEKLVIKGSFRAINPMISDVKIIVGKKLCTGITASDTALTCDPPEKPDGVDNEGRAPVTLKIGFFKRKVGNIRYYTPRNDDKPLTMGIILGVVLPIIFIIALLALCIIRRQRKTTPPDGGIPDMLKEEVPKDEEEEIGMNHLAVKADMNGQIPDQDSGPYISELLSRIENEATRQSVSDLLIPRSKISIGELIGKGTYGNTYEAQYKACKGADAVEKEMAVAVKALQGCNRDNESVDLFLQQCVTLQNLRHPNILSIIGVSLSAVDEHFVIRPYLQRGDLKNYVKDSSKNITVLELLEMANQIASAMEYLEELHIVHRNLAARNCLVTDDKVVKVSEFCITQLYPADYYKMEDGRIKDVKKWWAPEAMENLEFSHKTDCWSYGIVLWELLTRGVTPYPDVETKDLKDYLTGGHRLKKPRQCPENVYLLMLQCWTDVPKDRPTFQEISGEISKFISEDDSSGENQPLRAKIEPGGSQEYLEVIG